MKMLSLIAKIGELIALLFDFTGYFLAFLPYLILALLLGKRKI
jgi:hypothetical protein